MEKTTVSEQLHRFIENKADWQPLADFCQVSVRTASNWQQALPRGLTLTRLAIFLSVKTSPPIISWEAQPPDFKVGLALALGLASADKLAQMLAISHDYDVYRFIFGGRALSADKLALIDDLIGINQVKVAAFLGSNHSQAQAGQLAEFIKDFSELSLTLTKLEPLLDDYLADTAQLRHWLRSELETRDLSLFTSSNRLYRVLEKINLLCSEKNLDIKTKNR